MKLDKHDIGFIIGLIIMGLIFILSLAIIVLPYILTAKPTANDLMAGGLFGIIGIITLFTLL